MVYLEKFGNRIIFIIVGFPGWPVNNLSKCALPLLILQLLLLLGLE